MSRLSDHSQRTGRLSRRLALRPQAEALESRHLLAVTINEFPVTPTSSPFEMTKGPDNNLWFTDRGTDSIGMINPTTHAVTEFHLPAGETVPSRSRPPTATSTSP